MKMSEKLDEINNKVTRIKNHQDELAKHDVYKLDFWLPMLRDITLCVILITLSYLIVLEFRDVKQQLQNIDEHQAQLIEEIEIIKEIELDKKSNEYVLAHDLLFNQTHIKEEEIASLLNQIFACSKKYEIDPLLLYSVLWNESRLRNDVTHKTTYVKKLQKNVTAIGMGGVVWDFWGDEIIKNTSLTSKNDLYIKEKNIEATAFILNRVYSKPILKDAKNRTESALGRYYGKINVNYITKVVSKMIYLEQLREV